MYILLQFWGVQLSIQCGDGNNEVVQNIIITTTCLSTALSYLAEYNLGTGKSAKAVFICLYAVIVSVL